MDATFILDFISIHTLRKEERNAAVMEGNLTAVIKWLAGFSSCRDKENKKLKTRNCTQ